jgi:hypothetical protein
MAINRDGEEDIRVEVKAPFRQATGAAEWFDDSDLIQGALKNANKQFESGVPNLLVLNPDLPIQVSAFRPQLTRALFGESGVEVPINNETGGPAGRMKVAFRPTGRFLNRHLPSGKPIKLDHSPGFTRVDAVLTIEEFRTHEKVDHKALVAHNPYAEVPIPEKLFGNLSQLVDRDGVMEWTDA